MKPIRTMFVVISAFLVCFLSLQSCRDSYGSDEDMRKWWTLIEQGDIDGVRDLMRKGVPIDPHCGPNRICKPLAIAADVGNIEIMRLLIVAGADLNGENAYSNTPLIYAFNSKSPNRRDALLLLLESGADVNKPNCFGTNVFIASAIVGDMELLELSHKHGAKVNATYPIHCGSRGSAGNTALMYAAREGQVESVRFLLEHGADPAAQNTEGHDALYYARENGHKEVEALLR
jgi:ankyrin repeat protein